MGDVNSAIVAFSAALLEGAYQFADGIPNQLFVILDRRGAHRARPRAASYRVQRRVADPIETCAALLVLAGIVVCEEGRTSISKSNIRT